VGTQAGTLATEKVFRYINYVEIFDFNMVVVLSVNTRFNLIHGWWVTGKRWKWNINHWVVVGVVVAVPLHTRKCTLQSTYGNGTGCQSPTRKVSNLG
jgi:hypothetical protein